MPGVASQHQEGTLRSHRAAPLQQCLQPSRTQRIEPTEGIHQLTAERRHSTNGAGERPPCHTGASCAPPWVDNEQSHAGPGLSGRPVRSVACPAHLSPVGQRFRSPRREDPLHDSRHRAHALQPATAGQLAGLVRGDIMRSKPGRCHDGTMRDLLPEQV